MKAFCRGISKASGRRPVAIFLIATAIGLGAGGCTSYQLKQSTVAQGKTLTDLEYSMVLDNVAMFKQSVKTDFFKVVEEDIGNLELLADKLETHADPASKLIWNDLKANHAELISNDKILRSDPNLKRVIVDELNRLIQTTELVPGRGGKDYSASLGIETDNLLEERLPELQLQCLRRQSLENAYKGALLPSKLPVPWHLAFATGDIIIKDSVTAGNPNFSYAWDPISRTVGVSGSRNWQESWTVQPVIDLQSLKRLQRLYSQAAAGSWVHEDKANLATAVAFGSYGSKRVWVGGEDQKKLTDLTINILGAAVTNKTSGAEPKMTGRGLAARPVELPSGETPSIAVPSSYYLK